MRKYLVIALVLFTAGIAWSGTFDPVVEETNRIMFNYRGQETQTKFAISSIHWVSASGDEIGGTDGFILNDYAGTQIANCEATTISDQCHYVFPEPVIVNGFQVEDITGNLYIYGKRR